MNEELYREKMQQGRVCLGVGNLDMASVSYNAAAGYATDNMQCAQARHMRGIVLRLMGDFSNALRDFGKARKLARADKAFVARIQRDEGMCYLDQSAESPDLIGKAKQSTLSSMEVLLELGDEVEAAVSRGFLARVYLKEGDREWAGTLLRQAHRDLYGRHPVYEMNILP